MTQPALPTTVTVPETNVYTITLPTSTPQNYSYNMSSGAAGGGAGAAGNVVSIGAATATVGPVNTWTGAVGQFYSTGVLFKAPVQTHIIQFSNSGSEIVRLNIDGTVTWAKGIDIDTAAEAFSKSLELGVEVKAGISRSVKLKMRDSVFDDLINIAKEKGSLTAEDLTYLLEASKIVEKLKGGN